MFVRLTHNFSDRPAARPAPKLRPASHSYLVHREPLTAAVIFGLCGLLIYAAVWLIRLLG